MQLEEMTCPTCGAPVSIPPDVDHFTCSFCGNEIALERESTIVGAGAARQQPSGGWLGRLWAPFRLIAGCGVSLLASFSLLVFLILVTNPFFPEDNAEVQSKLDSALMSVSLLAGFLVFLFFSIPDSPIWSPARRLLTGRRNDLTSPKESRHSSATKRKAEED